jgi:hypothetical protein
MEAYQSFSTTINGTGNGTPGGTNTQIQFNNAGNFGGATGFTFNSTSNVMNVPGNIVASGRIVVDHLAGGQNGTLGQVDFPTGPDADLLILNNTGNIVLAINASSYNQWTFDVNGNLTLPGNTFAVNYANGTPVNIGGGGGGNSFSAITMTSTPSGPSNQINYGLGNLVAWNDGGWTIGEYNASTDLYATEGIRINPEIEGPVDITLPATQSANTQPTSVSNFIGNVVVNTGDDLGNSYQWKFGNSGDLILPSTTVVSTPVASGLNQTQKTISGSIETVAGNPLPSATDTLNQTETIWTATNPDVTAARMTLRIQYSVGPVTGMEMCDIVLAKEWGTNANVSYAISNRLRTNNSLGYANVVADLDGSNNLIVTVTNSSDTNEYYSYSVTEFNRTND